MNKAQVQGLLPEDAHGTTLQIPDGFQTIDATASPQVSPLTISTSNTLKVPSNAVCVNLYSTTAFYISEDSASASKDLNPASTRVKVPCAAMKNIYITVSSASVYFSFETLS